MREAEDLGLAAAEGRVPAGSGLVGLGVWSWSPVYPRVAMMERLLTARTISERLGVSVETVLRWRRGGRLPGGFRLATGVLRWREDELNAWLEERRELASVEREA